MLLNDIFVRSGLFTTLNVSATDDFISLKYHELGFSDTWFSWIFACLSVLTVSLSTVFLQHLHVLVFLRVLSCLCDLSYSTFYPSHSFDSLYFLDIISSLCIFLKTDTQHSQLPAGHLQLISGDLSSSASLKQHSPSSPQTWFSFLFSFS